MNITIIVAAHKKYWMPSDSVYMPLQVGADGKEDIGFQKDNTGDNISYKNANYCELTGLYWAWKNLQCDYIGLCHYRRYFGRTVFSNNIEKKHKAIFGREDYEKLLQQYDVILPKKRNYFIETVRSQYEHAHMKKDLDMAEGIIAELYPEYKQAFEKVMNSRKLHLYNMFVMSKKNFDNYCTWLFKILSVLEKKIGMTGYSPYQARVYGFLSERLFNVWLEHSSLNICIVPVINMEKVSWLNKIYSFIKRKYFK